MLRGIALLAAALLAAAAPAARADWANIITSGEVDLEITYDSGSRSLGAELHSHDLDIHLDPAETIYHGSTAASPLFQRTINNAALAAALGIAPGGQAYVFPQVENPLLPFIGIATAEDADESPVGFFDGPLTLTFTDVSGPGTFALWQAGEDPLAGIGTGNAVSIPTDGEFHDHFNWGFSEAGIYGITFRISGTLTDGTVVTSDDITLNFAVETNPVPAPPGVVLGLVGGLGMTLIARARNRTRVKAVGV